MEGRLPPPEEMEWDEEGFPVATLARVGEACGTQLDEESGEWVQQQVFVLRHHSRDPSPQPGAQPRLVQEVVQIHWPLVERGQLLRGYTRTMLSRLSEDLARAQGNTHSRRQPRTAPHHSDLEALKSRPMFQIPPEIFQELPQKGAGTGSTRICTITIWKEFIYAPSVLMLEQQHFTDRGLHGLKPVTCRLSKFINKRVVDWSLYVFFFGVYFLYCCIFSDVLELGLYLLFGNHLSFHQLASSSNIDMTFKGSFFEGPAYALIRMCCQHCTQRENAKVMWRHMAKMKKDIMNAKVA